jgi:hypothetical protein
VIYKRVYFLIIQLEWNKGEKPKHLGQNLGEKSRMTEILSEIKFVLFFKIVRDILAILVKT